MKRPCVMRYRAFKDECLAQGIEIGDVVEVVFVIPMPVSWSKKKREKMNGQPHQQKPDIDNLAKALMDVCSEDSHVWSLLAVKRWGEIGLIELGE
jgi:Holliday junction resolvase RusA-like endonuclease